MNIHNAIKIGALSLTVSLAGCGGGSSNSDGSISPQDAESPAVSWYSTAQPLVERYCSSCHTEGSDLAPFPFDTYEQVYSKISAIAYTLESDTMPPVGFLDITGGETQMLLDWIDAGAPEGDASQTPIRFTDLGYTYHRDIRALVEKHCVSCHVDGGVAPFALDSYEKVSDIASAAAFALESGDMPPWPPTEGYTRFGYERAIPGEDKFKMLNWLNGDLNEGNPADYVPPEQEAVATPEFNIEVTLPEPYTPTLRPDDHRCFAIDWPLDEVAYVTAVDVIPDEVAEVHHVIVNIIDPEDVHHYAGAGGADGNPGWPCLLSGGIAGAPLPRQIGGWVPGTPTGSAPEGTGIGIYPGSMLVVQMHYNTLVAEPAPDQSTIRIATTDSVERPSSGFLYTDPSWLGDGGMPIPAGDPNVHHSHEVGSGFLAYLFGGPAGVEAGDEWVIHNGFLHMHNLGTTGRTTLVRTDGTEQVILDIRDWDFNWQSTYLLDKELLVRPGDKIRMECTWDNTDENQVVVNGEQSPAHYVQWGDGTGDEMCLINILMTQKKEGYDYSYSASVHIESPSYRQPFKAGDLVPLELLFNNFSLHEPGAHGGDGHDDHDGDHSNVYSGHYHVYLDTDDDNAEHLTAWDAKYYYQLPDDIQPGVHNLRVSLRGEDHHGLGIEDSVDIEVVESAVAEGESLIDVDAWTFQPAAQDSSPHRPETVNCPDNSWGNEDGALEVETGYCEYLSLSQPSLVGIDAGDEIHLVLWHGNLVFESPATAHASITVDGNSVWSANVDIPSDAEIFDLRIPVDFDAPQGSKIEYHLHNHGYNTWTLLQLDVER